MSKSPRLYSSMQMGAQLRPVNLAAAVRIIPTAIERGYAERRVLYQSDKWRRVRAAFLAERPSCENPLAPGKICGAPARAVDHVDGHQFDDWLARFWNSARWMPLCLGCHGAKSARERAAWRRAGGGTR